MSRRVAESSVGVLRQQLPSFKHKTHKTHEQNTKYKYKHKTNVESNAAATFAPFEHQKKLSSNFALSMVLRFMRRFYKGASKLLLSDCNSFCRFKWPNFQQHMTEQQHFFISIVNWKFIWKVVFCVHSVHSVQCSEILLFATFTVWNVHCV